MSTFTIANEATLIARIKSAVNRVVFIAPGLFEGVANALIEKIAANGLPVLKVVVDADEDACRLGFGDISAVRKLKNAADHYGFMLCHQPGLRVGVLLTDSDVLVWSPAPLLVEEQSNNTANPNAIDIRDGSLDSLIKAVGVASANEDIQEQEVGLDPLPEDQLRKSEESLKRNPPKAFDLARKERVFSSILEFVEMKLTDYKMSKKVLLIPAELMVLSGDKDTQERWRSHFTIFEGHDCKVKLIYRDKKCEVDESFLDEERKRLDKEYLVAIAGYGKLIKIESKKDFQLEITQFKKLLEDYAKGIAESVTAHINKMGTQLTKELLPRFLKNPPPEFNKTVLFTETRTEAAKQYISEKLLSNTRRIEQHIAPKLEVVYKGITYETFKDKDFENKLNDKFGDGSTKKILREYDAAPEAGTHAKKQVDLF